MKFNLPNFLIQANAPISSICRERGLNEFHQVVDFIFKLPYRRNSSKQNLALVFSEKCGVCSTKHAALKLLASENNFNDIRLVVGIYQMNEENTPGVGNILKKYELEFIPEAHTYLVYQNERIDITREVESTTSPFESLLKEVEIQPNQISEHKVALHQAFLNNWQIEQNIKYSAQLLWEIREECIQALSNPTPKT